MPSVQLWSHSTFAGACSILALLPSSAECSWRCRFQGMHDPCITWGTHRQLRSVLLPGQRRGDCLRVGISELLVAEVEGLHITSVLWCTTLLINTSCQSRKPQPHGAAQRRRCSRKRTRRQHRLQLPNQETRQLPTVEFYTL